MFSDNVYSKHVYCRGVRKEGVLIRGRGKVYTPGVAPTGGGGISLIAPDEEVMT